MLTVVNATRDLSKFENNKVAEKKREKREMW